MPARAMCSARVEPNGLHRPKTSFDACHDGILKRVIRFLGELGRELQGDEIVIARADERGSANFENDLGPLHRATADMETISSLWLRHCFPGSKVRSGSLRQRRQPAGRHRSLRVSQMPPMHILIDDELQRLRAIIVARSKLDVGLGASAITISAVKDFSVAKPDRLAQPILLDRGDERLELGTYKLREDSGKRVNFERGERRHGNSPQMICSEGYTAQS